MDLAWDGDGQLPVNGGSGLWDLTTRRWFDGSGFVPWTNSGNDAVFGATGSVLVLPGVAVRNMTFADDYSLINSSPLPTTVFFSGTTLDTGAHRVDLQTGAVGTTGFTKSGSGLLVLYAPTNVTGPWTIQSGTLALGNSTGADIPNVSLSLAAGATLDLGIFGGACNETIGILSGAGNVVLREQSGFGAATGSRLTVGADNASGVFSGVISGSGGRFTKTGLGTLTLSGANTYSGVTTLNAGTLFLDPSGSLSDQSAVSISGASTILLGASKSLGSLANGGSNSIVNMQSHDLLIGADGRSTQFTGVLAGSGRLIKVGHGELSFATNPSVWSGGVTIQNGRFLAQLDSRLGSAPTAPDPGNITLDGGAFGNTSGTSLFLNVNRGITVTANNGGIVVSGATSTLSVFGGITGSGRITKSGAGTLQLNDSSNAFGGGIDILDGILASEASSGTPLGAGSVLLSRAHLNLAPASVGAATLSFGDLAYGPGASIRALRTTSLAASFGAMTRQSGGTLVLVPANGIADLGSAGASFIRITAGGVGNNVNGGVPAVNGDIATPSILSTTSDTNLSGEFVRYGANGFTVGTYSTVSNINLANNTDVFNAAANQSITGSASVFALNVRSGVTVSGGALTVGAGSEPATVIVNGGTLSASSLNFGERHGILYAGGTSASTIGTISSNITGTSGITKIGGANLRLNSTLSFSGGLTVAAGTLTLGASNLLPTATALTLSGPGSRLALIGTQQTIATLHGESTATTIDLGSAGVLTVSGTQPSQYRGAITGTNGSTLIKQGAGMLTLGESLSTAATSSALNSYQRLIVRNAGIVAISSGNSLPPALNPGMFPVLSDTLRFDGGTLRITSINDNALSSESTFSIASGTAQRGITLAAGGGTLDVVNPLETVLVQLDDVQSRNIISGAGDLTKTGPGALRLGPGNSYTGKTIVLQGTLQIPGDSALGAPGAFRFDALQIADGAVLQSTGSASFSPNRGLSLIGNVGAGGAGAAILNTANGAFIFNGPIGGPGSLKKVGAGSHSLVLNDFNDFGGDFTIEAGRVDFNAFGSAGGGLLIIDPRHPVVIGRIGPQQTDLLNDVQLLSGSTIDFDVPHAATISLGGMVSGPGSFNKVGAGTLILNGAGNSFSGKAHILEGALVVGETNALGSTDGATMIAPGAMMVLQEVIHPSAERTYIAAAGNGAGAIQHLAGNSLLGGTITLMSDAAIGVAAGTLKIDTVAGASVVTKLSPGLLSAERFRTSGLNISQGTVTLSQKPSVGNPADTSRFELLTLAGGSTPTVALDITNNALVVSYSASDSEPFDTIRAQIIHAYNANQWDLPGITSSLASGQFGIGYAESSALTVIPAVFAPIDSPAVLVRYTRYGDANLDGLVSLPDFNRLAANFGSTNAVWTQGDFNYDGMVTLPDFNRLAANFGLSAGPEGPTPADWAALATAVPEPTASLLLPCAGLSVLLRRQRMLTSCPN